MTKLLGSMTLIAALALSSAALACSRDRSVSADSQPVVSATSQPAAPATTPTTEGTTKPKTTEVDTGG
jgi:hypothetical protein